MSNSNTGGLNSKLIEHFNEMLSAENAGIDYLQTRIDQTPLQSAKQRMQQHLIIEKAEIVAYDMLIQIVQRSNLEDAIPVLKQTLREEEAMADWIKTNT